LNWALDNHEILFKMHLPNADDIQDDFTECNTFSNDPYTIGYDNAFANANAWVASPMTARNGSQSMTFNPVSHVMHIRSGNTFYTLQSVPLDITLSNNKNTWEVNDHKSMFSESAAAYPVYSFTFHKRTYQEFLAYNGNCVDHECGNSVFNEINAYSPPSYGRGGNYNICRFMIYKYATGYGSAANGLYQFDGVNSKDTEGIGHSYLFPTLERDVIDPTGDSPSFELNIPSSYGSYGQVQHSILNYSAKYRKALGTNDDLDTEYDPPAVVSLKEVNTSTGESMYLSDIITSDNPSIDSYSPYLLIRYPIYQGSSFTQGVGGYETNRSFAFCSTENQMQIAYDRTSKATGSSSLDRIKITEVIEGGDDYFFGSGVSILEDLAIVANSLITNDISGIYIYRENDGEWLKEFSHEIENRGWLGYLNALDISQSSYGIVAVAGAGYLNTQHPDGANEITGIVYFYRVNGEEWDVSSVTPVNGENYNDQFGRSVSIDGNTAVIGAPMHGDSDSGSDGRFYIYGYDGTSWSVTAFFDKPEFLNATTDNKFGVEVCIKGNTIIVAAEPVSEMKHLFIYKLADELWTEVQNFESGLASADRHNSIDISEDENSFVIGDSAATPNNFLDGGGVHYYVSDGDGGDYYLVQTFHSDSPAENGHFGNSVSLSGDKLLVGEPHTNQGWGKAYFYSLVDGYWESETTLSSQYTSDNNFGYSVSMFSSDVYIIGAIGHSPGNLGFATIYHLYGGSQDPDTGYTYSYGIGNNLGNQHGTFMQLDWHDTAGGGFLDDVNPDEMYLVQDVVRNLSDMSEKDTNTSGGQICSINFAGSSFSPVLKYQNIFSEGLGVFSGNYPQLTEGAITIGCHTASSSTPDFIFPYRAPFFLMDYYKEDNNHYQPMGFFVDNMSDSGSFYRKWTTHIPIDIDPYGELDPYYSRGVNIVEGACCIGGNCYMLTSENCVHYSGSYLGDYTECEAGNNPCESQAPTGACCLGTTCAVRTEDECDGSGGIYLGDNFICEGDTCDLTDPFGACCIGSVCSFVTASECGNQKGYYHGKGTLCEDINCEDGCFQGIEWDVMDSELGIGLTYRLYALVYPGSQINAVYGDGDFALTIKSSTGFYQNTYGGATSKSINPEMYDLFPELRYDSWVTIGLEDNVGNNMLDIGIDWTAFEGDVAGGSHNNGGEIWTDNGSWFATPDNAQVHEVDGRVLLGQFTTHGEITGSISLLGKCANDETWNVLDIDISTSSAAPPLAFATILDEGDGVSRMQRCQEILIDLFDMNFGQVYCNDFITISSLDFISGEIPASYPSLIDFSGKISNKRVNSKEDLRNAVEVARTMPSSIDVNIDNFFYNLNCTNIDSTIKEWVSPYRPYKSMVFMITSNDYRFILDNGDGTSYVDSSYITEIIQSLRNNYILHTNGSIHIVDLVPRDIGTPVRSGLSKLAEMSGGSYTPLRGDQ
jgi:hypothetical protein